MIHSEHKLTEALNTVLEVYDKTTTYDEVDYRTLIEKTLDKTKIEPCDIAKGHHFCTLKSGINICIHCGLRQ